MRYTAGMRAFLALPLATEDAASLYRAGVGLHLATNQLRLTPPEGLHLTLAFLGDIGQEMAEAALLAAGNAVDAYRRTTLRIESGLSLRSRGIVTFPSRGPALVIAAAIDEGGADVARLADLIERELELVGRQSGVPFRPRERRPYTAHITLARAKRPGIRLSEAERAVPLGWAGRVDRVALFSSELGRGGARYECLGEVMLDGSDGQTGA